MSQYFRLLIVVVTTPVILFAGCAQMFNGNLNELVTETRLTELPVDTELENYKYDSLAENAQSLRKLLESEAIDDDQTNTDSNPNDFVPEAQLVGHIEPIVQKPAIRLLPFLPEGQTDANVKNPIFHDLDSQPLAKSPVENKLVQMPPDKHVPPMPLHEKLVVGLVPVNKVRERETPATENSIPSTAPSLSFAKLPAIDGSKTELVAAGDDKLAPWMPPPFADSPKFESLDHLASDQTAKNNQAETAAVAIANEEFEANLKAHFEYVDQLVVQTMENKYAELIETRTEQAEPELLPWSDQLDKTIAALETEIKNKPETKIANEISDALKIMRSLEIMLNSNGQNAIANNEQLQQSWEHQIDALHTIIENSNSARPWASTASTALDQLNLATKPLRDAADLKLANSGFCRKVSGYGQYETFSTDQFKSNQPVLVYCEIENFTPTKTSEDGIEKFRTKISSSFWIKDSAGNIVQETDYPAVADYARNIRRDFFMHVPVQFADLQSGEYTLQLRVEDFGSGKTATLNQPLNFRIR